jgi:dTDP-4-dehydrorhamnose reductase
MGGGQIVVLGNGQLGTALARTGGPAVTILDRTALDLTQFDAIAPALARYQPAVVINAAAYNAVDGAEAQPDQAFAVNAIAPGLIARAAWRMGARFVTVSTDYVFDGDAHEPYLEDALPRPLGVYGASKLAGEYLALAYAPQALVVRTSTVFGAARSARPAGFINTILRKLESNPAALEVVTDQRNAPTYALDLATTIFGLLERGASGVIHVANAGACSRYELALATVEALGLTVPVVPVATAERPGTARRPRYSVLGSSRLPRFGIDMPHWQDALNRYLLELGRTVHPAGS